MKKYEEALDNIFRYYVLHDDEEEWCDKYETSQEDFGALQELIDKYNSIIGDYMSYKDLKAEYEQKLAMYKKALDKACDILAANEHACCNSEEDFCKRMFGVACKSHWKERLLKDE